MTKLSSILKLIGTALLLSGCVMTQAQTSGPLITTLYPITAQVGTDVTVDVRGSELNGATGMLVYQPGITGKVFSDEGSVDKTNQPLWSEKCGSCHELRSPANRDLSPEAWAATVQRMITKNQAPISPQDAQKITEYLQSAARGSKVMANIKVAADAVPGIYMIRLVTPLGITSPVPFEVTSLPVVQAVPSNPKLLSQPVTLPCVVNGCIERNGEMDRFQFSAVQGARYVFNLRAFRYNILTQFYFNPILRLYDSSGNKIAENDGYHELDPLLDWKCTQSGTYVLEVRDLLGDSNPGDVYHLTMGSVPYNKMLFPPGGRAGSTIPVALVGNDIPPTPASFQLHVPDTSGLTTVNTTFGPAQFFSSPYPVTLDTDTAQTIQLPAGFAGRLLQSGKSDTFYLDGEGAWNFRLFCSQLGGDGDAEMELQDSKGHVVATQRTDRSGEWFNIGLHPKEVYSLHVTSSEGSNRCVYFVEARPLTSTLYAAVRPDISRIYAGSSTTVMVRIFNRGPAEGPITISALKLPPGVHINPAVVAQDQDRVPVVLTADADAQPSIRRILFQVSKEIGNKVFTSVCVAQQPIQMQQDTRYFDVSESVMQVSTKPPLSASIKAPDGTITLRAHGGVEIPLHINWSPDANSPVITRVEGLPRGWTSDGQSVSPGQSDIKILIRPYDNETEDYAKRDPKFPPVMAVIELVDRNSPIVVGTYRVVLAPPQKKTA